MLRLTLPVIFMLVIGNLTACSNNAERMAEAEKLFVKNCSGCHGADGMGKPYREIPANLLTSKSKDQIIRQILEGSEHKQQIKMRAMKHLSPEQAEQIAEFMIHRQKQDNSQ